jgi:phosphatidylglycerol:prolipoprotein diacylglycerol transferase
MHPYIVDIPLPWGGTLPVASYGVMIMCGFLLCLFLARIRASKTGLNPDDIYDVAFAMLVGGIIGARLFYVVQFWNEAGFGERPLTILRIDKGGLVFYGGVIGGGVAFLVSMLCKKMPFRLTLDVIGGLIPLGHAFGRTGCFLNGCCFGHRTSFWLGIRFPRVLRPGNVEDELFNVGDNYIAGSPPFLHHLQQGLVLKTSEWSLPVHPTQLYAIVYNLAIFAFLTYWFRKSERHPPGEVAWLYCVTYGVARFFNEVLRVTEPLAMGLTVAQIISVFMVAFGITMLVVGRKRWDRCRFC